MTDKQNKVKLVSSNPAKRRRSKPPESVGASTTAPLFDTRDLTNLIKTFRELGVTEFSQGDLHFKLGPVPPPLLVPEEVPSVVAGTPHLGPVNQEISDEDMLFWSSDALDAPKDSAK